MDKLVDALIRATETDTLFHLTAKGDEACERRSPWVWGRLRFELCHTLCAWIAGDDGRMRQVLPGLLASVRLADEYTAALDVGPVLQWLWPGRNIRIKVESDGTWDRDLPRPVTAEELTGLRRLVVEACYENEQIWGTRIGNTHSAFMRVGLPTSRIEVGKLLWGN